jgi:hypothetical protein
MENKMCTRNKSSENTINRQKLYQENLRKELQSQMAVNGKRKTGIFYKKRNLKREEREMIN